MVERSVEERLRENSARIMAIEMVVESLLAHELAQNDDPTAAGNAMADAVLKSEEAVRNKHGGSDYVLQVSEAASSLIFRAVTRALSLREKGFP